MRSPNSLRAWTRELLPARSCCAPASAWELLRALLVEFTSNLTQLARQADRNTTARVARQFFSRWLGRSQWDLNTIYAGLPRLVPSVWRQRQIPLLIDFTFVGEGGEGWSILQVSLPWQRRALPVYRAVTRRTEPEWGQTQLLLASLGWLRQVLPGPQARYVLVLDRGFPSHRLIHELQALGWRFVLRINADWTLTHREYTGRLKGLGPAGRLGPVPQLCREAILGRCVQGQPVRNRSCRVNVVWYLGPGHQEPWFLATTERQARAAVAIYRERMRIEAEFRDLKGAWGLDALATWTRREAVARFLAWVAIYEWRLAYLWHRHQLEQQARNWQAYGPLSWIRLTREWIARQLRPPKGRALACL